MTKRIVFSNEIVGGVIKRQRKEHDQYAVFASGDVIERRPKDQPVSDDDDDDAFMEACNQIVQGKRVPMPPARPKPQVVFDDAEAAEIIFDAIKGNYLRCGGRCFAKIDGIWREDMPESQDNTVGCWLRDHCARFDLRKLSTGKNPQELPFSRTSHGVNAIIPFLRMLAPVDPYFMDRVHASTLGKVVFTDGYYDIRKKQFIKGHDGVESMVCVPHAFPARDENMIKQVMHRILAPTLPDEGQRTLVIQTMARAVFGHIEDKRLSVHEGAERNNGKGTLQDITQAALGTGYVGAIGSANFIKGSRHKAEDPDKARMWMFAGQHARFVFSNEMEGDHIDGEIIKAWASGGDPMRARKLFRMPIDFKIQAYLIFNVNDFPPVSPPNAVDGIMPFRFDVKFETQAQLDQHRKEGEDMSLYALADPSVKDFARSKEAGAAFLHILIDHYVDKAPEITPEMRSRQLAYAAKTEEEVIAQLIELTQDPRDYVSNSDLSTAISRAQVSGITVNRIGNFVRRRYSKMVWQVRGKVGGERILRGIRLKHPID